MKEHLNEFLEYLKFEKGLSDNTLEAYGRDLSKFLAYLQLRKIETPGDVKRSDILAFISHLLDEGAAFSSSARHLSSIKSFFSLSGARRTYYHQPGGQPRKSQDPAQTAGGIDGGGG